ncbi:MAG: WG repeat-containing protein, partial [Sphingobacteriales bacterium]
LYCGGKQGLITDYGRIYLPPLYDRISSPMSIGNRFLVVQDGGKYRMIDYKGNPLTELLDSISSDAYILRDVPAVKDGNRVTIGIAQDGSLKLDNAPASKTRTSYNGYSTPAVIIEENGKYGLYDNRSGAYVLPAQYEDVEDKRLYFIAWKYKRDKRLGMDSTYVFTKDLQLIKAEKGLVSVSQLDDDLLLLEHEGRQWVYNNFGKLVMADSLKMKYYMDGQRLLVVSNGSRVGIADINGNIKTPLTLDGIPQGEHWESGFIKGVKNGKYALIGKDGKLLTAPLYDFLDENVDDGSKGLTFIAAKGGRWGVLDAAGSVRVPLVHDTIQQLYAGRLLILKKGKWGIIDIRSGKTVAPFVYDEIGRMYRNQAYFEKGEKSGYLDDEGKEK